MTGTSMQLAFVINSSVLHHRKNDDIMMQPKFLQHEDGGMDEGYRKEQLRDSV